MMSPLTLFLLLLVAHAIADYPLQGDFIARAKNRFNPIPNVPWYQPMAAHSTIHGGMVGVLTGSVALGVAEFVCHFGIDYWKTAAEKADGPSNAAYNVDQAAHVLCKLLWVCSYVLMHTTAEA